MFIEHCSSHFPVISNVSGKLAYLNRQLFKSHYGNTTFVADLLAHEVNFAERGSVFAILDENFERNQKISPEHLERDSRIYIQSNFSSPVVLQLFSSIRDRKIFSFDDPTVNEEAFVYLVINRTSVGKLNSDNFPLNGTLTPSNPKYSACIYYRHFEFVNVRAKLNLHLDYDRESQIKKLCVTSLHQDRHLAMPLVLGSTKISKILNSKHTINVFFNPKIRVTFRLMMLLQSVKSVEALTRFVQVELNNPTATLTNQHHMLPMLEFRNDRVFSNETLQLIEDSCQPHYRNDGLFVVSPKEVVKEMASFLEGSYPSIRASSCPMHIAVHMKHEYPWYTSEVTLYNY